MTGQNSPIEIWVKIRDLEERQRILRDRILLIGKNLIESKEETEKTLGKIKRNLSSLKDETTKIKEILLTITEELSNTAKKSEIIAIENQLKMFSPLELVRIKDIENIIEEKLKKGKRKKET